MTDQPNRGGKKVAGMHGNFQDASQPGSPEKNLGQIQDNNRDNDQGQTHRDKGQQGQGGKEYGGHKKQKEKS